MNLKRWRLLSVYQESRYNIRIWLIIAFIFLFSLFILASLSLAQTKPIKRIYIPKEEKVSYSQCIFCHKIPGDYRSNRLIFSHGVHILIDCYICHTEFPHELTQGFATTARPTTKRPSMSVCFSCHGVKHGKQQALASSGCNTCHPKGFRKVPSNHTWTWKKSTHKQETGESLRNCQICHPVSFCDSCHQKKGVKVNLANIYFFSKVVAQSLLTIRKELPVLLPIRISSAQPVAISQCSFCHETPGDFVTERIKFKHSVHVRIRCNSCHQEFPHQPTGTKRPTMDICFSCHAMLHGPQAALASGRCETCHPRSFPKVPANHGRWFRKTGHKLVTGQALRNCQMCHTVSFCESCHRRKGIRSRSSYEYFFESFIIRKPVINLTFEITSLGTMSNCGLCHSNIDAFKNPKLIFKHDLHLKRGFSCNRCHVVFPHYTKSNISDEAKQAMAKDLIRWKIGRSGITAKPSMRVCYGCHDLIHSKQGLVATGRCNACHPRGFNYVPSNHGRWFRATGHKNAARVDLDGCEMCHRLSFCQTCHNKKRIIPPAHGLFPKAPPKVREKWRETHGRKEIRMCLICHAQTYCDSCHRTRIPHEVTWLGSHPEQARRQGITCRMCHEDEEQCNDCHHGDVRTVKLTRGNCTRCHDILKKDFNEINRVDRHRGFAVHAAHFAMTQTPPFACYKCHGETIRSGSQYYSFDQICYKCHGVWRRGKLVAKWPGKELCYRCHERK